MRRTAVLNVVGLTQGLMGPNTPHLTHFASGKSLATIQPAFPAVTCSAQANYVTGRRPRDHGIVGNGWYDRSLAEVHFWKQSNYLVQSPKIWDDLRQADKGFTCAKLFWWYNMYSSADYSITPRPIYPADGRKIFDVYTAPFSIRPEIKAALGEFPFPAFWGPAAGTSSRFASTAATDWIAQSARWIEEKYQPTLSLIYLPHLDYNLQRLGPDHPDTAADVRQIDVIAGGLIDFFHARQVQVLVVSEYGLSSVNHPVHLNRLFRERGWLAIKEELGLEMLDCGASRVFAVADHQIAHIYLNDPSLRTEVFELLSSTPGVERVLNPPALTAIGLDHPRAGDWITVADKNSWFTYYYWLDDQQAPDFARTIDIHRKPGYDPVELFLDPQQKWIRWKIARRLLQKKLGFRMLLDVIPLDASLVKGSHGRADVPLKEAPVFIGPASIVSKSRLDSTEIYGLIRRQVLDG